MIKLAIICIIVGAFSSNAEFYEDRRCSCICPGVEKVGNIRMGKSYFRDNIPPSQCNCNEMVLPRIGHHVNGSMLAFCMECECKYETRNTAVIMVVIILLCWTISLLLVYMGCLHLVHWISYRHRETNRPQNTEHGPEEEHITLLNAPESDSDYEPEDQ